MEDSHNNLFPEQPTVSPDGQTAQAFVPAPAVSPEALEEDEPAVNSAGTLPEYGPDAPTEQFFALTAESSPTAGSESPIAEQFAEDQADTNSSRWRYALAAVGGAIPGVHYLLEDPVFASLQAKLTPYGPTDLRHALTIVGLTGVMALEGYGVGHLTNKVDFIAQKVDALGDKARNLAGRIGQKALNGIKRPLDYAASATNWVGKKLDADERSRASRFIGKQLVDTAEVVALGTPGAVAFEKNEPGKRIPEKRIAKLAGLFALSWWPTYEAAKGIVYGTYDGLHALSEQGVPMAAGADTAAHDAFRLVGNSVDYTKVSGWIVMGSITASMMATAVRAEYRNRKNRNQAENASTTAPLQASSRPL